MKALASEIVRKLGRRLEWLAIQVKELTGVDQQYMFLFYSSKGHARGHATNPK
jgi:hypothetical protein